MQQYAGLVVYCLLGLNLGIWVQFWSQNCGQTLTQAGLVTFACAIDKLECPQTVDVCFDMLCSESLVADLMPHICHHCGLDGLVTRAVVTGTAVPAGWCIDRPYRLLRPSSSSFATREFDGIF